jgi:DNA-binding transcriptional ArsR family regulator
VKTYASQPPGRLLDALGDPTRRAIFEHLGERPSAVVDLAALLPVSRPAVSQHLKVLKDAGLVRDVQVGTRRVYSLDPDGLVALRDYMDRFWNTALHSFKARVERPETGSPTSADRPAANRPVPHSPATNNKEKKP